MMPGKCLANCASRWLGVHFWRGRFWYCWGMVMVVCGGDGGFCRMLVE